jgi:hypothetical protein
VAVAWLHDVIEDSPWTADRLIDAGIPAEVVDAVVDLTHGDDGGLCHPGRVRAAAAGVGCEPG